MAPTPPAPASPAHAPAATAVFATSRAPLSVVIITRDARAVLAPCIASAAFADEVVVLDSGSEDGTTQLARSLGARVVEGDWPGFGLQKQKAVNLARHDWVLCLDADERVSTELRRAIEAALAAPGATGVWRMARANRFMGRTLRHGEGYPDWSVRLFHRAHARWSDDPVHEKVLTGEAVGTLDGDLLHDSADSLEAYLAKQNRYTTLQARQLFERGERAGVARVALSPLVRFVKFYFLRRGFLDGLPGFVHIAIGCFNSMMKFAKLHAMERP